MKITLLATVLCPALAAPVVSIEKESKTSHMAEVSHVSVEKESKTSHMTEVSHRALSECRNTCEHASDGDCDDGGSGSEFSVCLLGSDCNDCGPRAASSPSPPTIDCDRCEAGSTCGICLMAVSANACPSASGGSDDLRGCSSSLGVGELCEFDSGNQCSDGDTRLNNCGALGFDLYRRVECVSRSLSVQVLDGGSGRFPATTCVSDPTLTAVHGATIAAQCCDPSQTGNSRCRRFVGTNDDNGCIAGKPPRSLTFAQAEAACAAHNLVMCDRTCAGTGCMYNNYPVWTKLPCTEASPSPAPITAPRSSSPPPPSPSPPPPRPPPPPSPSPPPPMPRSLSPPPSSRSLSVQVLDGGSGRFPATTCVSDPSLTAVHGATIAAQCCDPSQTTGMRCRRYVGTNDDNGCIAGKPPRSLTFAQAEAACAAHNLVMCDRKCAGTGCQYNNNPVWTNLPCTAPPPSPAPTAPAPTAPAPTAPAPTAPAPTPFPTSSPTPFPTSSPTPFPTSSPTPFPAPTAPAPTAPVCEVSATPPRFQWRVVPDAWKQITCPFTSALVKNGRLVPDDDGIVSKEQMQQSMAAAGVSRAVIEATTNDNFDHLCDKRINVFRMNTLTKQDPVGPREHFRSTGIRDRFVTVGGTRTTAPREDIFDEFESLAKESRGTFSGNLYTRNAIDFAVDLWDSNVLNARGQKSNDQLEIARPAGCKDDESLHGNFGTTRNVACESALHDSVRFLLQEMGSPVGRVATRSNAATMSETEMRRLWLDAELPAAFVARAPTDCIDVKAGHFGCQECLDAVGAPGGEAKYCRCMEAKLDTSTANMPTEFNVRCL